MRIFKFGGSSIHNAKHIEVFANIISNFSSEKLVIVASAMDKTTNNLELLHKYFLEQKQELLFKQLEKIKKFHLDIINDLFGNNSSKFFSKIETLFFELEQIVTGNCSVEDEDRFYDKIVSYGELISTVILSEYLKKKKIENKWLDARELICTDSNFKEAGIDWKCTEIRVKKSINFLEYNCYLIQGFIASDKAGNTTTLGREGSDYTAAILGYILNSKDVTVWKDVSGIFNKDPNKYADAKKIDMLSYHETIELSYYGARVIHPKTIKPLQNRKIPLFVKSFYNPKEKGTVISSTNQEVLPPIFIEKNNQTLLTIYPFDFSFIVEKHLEKLFYYLNKYKIKTSLLQHSAISFSTVFDDNHKNFSLLVYDLSKEFKVLYNKGLSLITIRHYTERVIEELTNGKEIFIEQKTRKTARFVLK